MPRAASASVLAVSALVFAASAADLAASTACPFHALRPASVHPYKFYLARLEAHIGKRRLEEISGLDILRWHRVWSNEGKHLAAAAMARTVLESALSLGVMSRLKGCAELSVIVREARKKLPRPKPRNETMTAEQVVAARAAAHAAGRPSRALAYAIAYETTLRLWDVIGQWWPLHQGGISDVIDAKRGRKWFGIRWEDIDDELVIRYTPSKTDEKTGKTISYPLAKAPMVMEELAHWPRARRKGPIIVSETTGSTTTGCLMLAGPKIAGPRISPRTSGPEISAHLESPKAEPRQRLSTTPPRWLDIPLQRQPQPCMTGPRSRPPSASPRRASKAGKQSGNGCGNAR